MNLKDAIESVRLPKNCAHCSNAKFELEHARLVDGYNIKYRLYVKCAQCGNYVGDRYWCDYSPTETELEQQKTMTILRSKLMGW